MKTLKTILQNAAFHLVTFATALLLTFGLWVMVATFFDVEMMGGPQWSLLPAATAAVIAGHAIIALFTVASLMTGE